MPFSILPPILISLLLAFPPPPPKPENQEAMRAFRNMLHSAHKRKESRAEDKCGAEDTDHFMDLSKEARDRQNLMVTQWSFSADSRD